jgi:hypothetical protein
MLNAPSQTHAPAKHTPTSGDNPVQPTRPPLDTNRYRRLPVRSITIAAALHERGHAVIGVDYDERLNRDVFIFDARTAQDDFDGLMQAVDELRAIAERAGGTR